jgi:hypothetical protein
MTGVLLYEGQHTHERNRAFERRRVVLRAPF